LYFSDIKQLDQ
jgi:hypothetical protein